MSGKTLADGHYDDDDATPPSPRRIDLAALLAKSADAAPDTDAETDQQVDAGDA